jgi:pimeloyl-ACP methyl ester carboxylesterase
VVACHGLRASKDSDKYLLLATELPRAGLALARFDFRGCGESTGTEDETTVATRIADVEALMGFLAGHSRLSGRFGLLGSSLGGFVALHVAARRQDDTPVVTWNAPAHLLDLADRVDTEGVGVPFLLELATHRHDAAPGVARHLVIQGDADDVVPLEHGVVLHSRARPPCDLVVVPGGDHRLTDPTHRRAAVADSVRWFGRFFSPADDAARVTSARD